MVEGGMSCKRGGGGNCPGGGNVLEGICSGDVWILWTE